MEEETLKIYTQFQQHLLDGRRSSFQQYDKAILTLSGGGLALSLTFIDGVVPLSDASWKGLLVAAWTLFSISVLSTLCSFITSQCAFDRQLLLAERYYLENDDNALKELNKPSRYTQCMNIGSALSFILAVVSLVVFVSINICEEVPMSETSDTDKIVHSRQAEVPAKLIQTGNKANEFGEPPPAIMKTPHTVEKGEVPANMPAKPSQQPTQASKSRGTAGAATGGAGSSKE